MAWTISRRAQQLTSSAIREILKVTERPEVISFAGGLPSSATFPVERLRAACEEVLAKAPSPALQYGPTEGYMPLREWVAAKHGVDASDVLITTGSQQGLDLIGKVLIDVGSRVLVETPTYLGALQSFSLSEPQFVSVAADEEGIVPDRLTAQLTQDARFLYCLPDFQNPTGRRLPVARREALVRVAADAGLPLLEDNPYGALAYSGDELPTLHSLNPDGVMYMGSFSKVLAPGLRVAYLIAPAPVHRKIVQAKQAADLHTPSFTQRIVFEVIKDGFLDEHIPRIRRLYADQCQAMLQSMQRHFPTSVRWNEPCGGMFIWVELPAHIDAMALLERAIAQNVAFVPGGPFFANDPAHHTLRLSFVTVPKDKIEEGIARLGRLIAQACE